MAPCPCFRGGRIQTNSRSSLMLFCPYVVVLDASLLHLLSRCTAKCSPRPLPTAGLPRVGLRGRGRGGGVSITTSNKIRPEAPQELLLFTATNEVASRGILQQGSGAAQMSASARHRRA